MISSHSSLRIFVAHSSKDNDFGILLVENLRLVLGDESAVWYDKRGGLQGGDLWWRKIVEELTARPVFIVILSPDALSSPWVNAEIDMAWKQRLSKSSKLILPILHRPCEQIRADIGMLEKISFLPPKSYETAFTELLVALGLPTDQKLKDSIRDLSDPRRIIAHRMTSQIEIAFAEQDWPKVIRQVDYLLTEVPTAMTATLYQMQGRALLSEGEVQLARTAFDNALAVVSDHEERLTLLRDSTVLLMSAGQWNEVLDRMKEALCLAPGDPYWLTVQQVAQREIQKALSTDMSTQSSGKARNIASDSNLLPNTTLIPSVLSIEEVERAIRALPTNRPTQRASTLSSPIIKEPITLRRNLSTYTRLLFNSLVLLIIVGSVGLILFNFLIDRSGINDVQATATAYMTTAIAKNPDPYPPTKGKLVLYDPLSQDSKNWDNRSEIGWGASCQFTNGSYRVSETHSPRLYGCPPSPNSTFSNFAFEVQMKIMEGDCGGIFFRNSEKGGYVYIVCQDGAYFLILATIPYGTITKIIKELISDDSSTIHKGLNQSNIIAVMADGSTIDFYMNNQKIDSVRDSISNDGSIGLIAVSFSNPTEVVYSYAKVWAW
jgi:hypothetical protein